MSTAVPAEPVVEAIIAKLEGDLPADSYEVHDAEGPTTPLAHVPYVVVYSDPGIGDGAPMAPNRELRMTFSVRAVGVTAQQARQGADRVRASLDNVTIAAGGRRVSIWQTHATPVTRDDSLAPAVLFEGLLVFGLLSTI